MRQLKLLLITLSLPSIVLLSSMHSLRAQEPCGTDSLLKEQLKALGLTKEQYEQQFNERIRELRKRSPEDERTLQDKVYKVPVVIHILYYPEDEYNISDEAVYEQMRITNEHYKEAHANVDRIPERFEDARAGDIGIEFHLAQRSPEGVPTTGITRTEVPYRTNLHPGNSGGWANIEKYRPEWNRREYLNVWIAPPASLPGGLLGIARLPIGGFRGFDGTVVNTRAFGVRATNPYVYTGMRGTTLSHELGHSLHLYHTFHSRGECSDSDFCVDTPNQSRPSYGNSFCRSTTSCVSVNMIENYMDYSADACQLMFTSCQRGRARATMEFNEIRKGLHEKHGNKLLLDDIEIREGDLGIRGFSGSKWSPCEKSFVGDIRIANYGSTSVNSLEIGVYIDDTRVQLISEEDNIRDYAGQDVSININADPLSTGAHTLSIRVVKANEKSDTRDANSTVTFSTYAPPTSTDVSDIEDNIYVFENDRSVAKIVSGANSEGKMLLLDMLNSDPSSLGQSYELVSPRFDVPGVGASEVAVLSFRYSYRGAYDDLETAMYVYATEDCSLTPSNMVYANSGLELNTSTLQSIGEPPLESHWRSVRIPISGRDEEVSFVILVRNGRSGNLYIDDIELEKVPAPQESDIALLELIVPELVCEGSVQGLFTYTNYKLEGTDVEMSVALDGTEVSAEKSNLTSSPSSSVPVSWGRFSVSENSSSTGSDIFSEVRLSLTSEGDPVVENNLDSTGIIYAPMMSFPLPIEDSGEASDALWQSATSALDGPAWQRVGGGKDYFKASFYNQGSGYVAKLISPLSNLKFMTEGTISFRVSYAQNGTHSDRLQLFVFRDCVSVPETLYDKRGSELSIRESTSDWEPTAASDWRREEIDISGYVGREQTHFMFVATSASGNNIYLDDIRIEASQSPPVVSSFMPERGGAGTMITIEGTHFSETASENELRFGAARAAVPTSASTTSLTVVVPSRARTGSISVTVNGLTGTSSTDFTVIPSPVVSSFSPTEGRVGTSVTITGEYFSDVPSENELRFGDVMASVPTSASTTSLVVLVPSGARTGSISVTVKGLTGTSSTNFTVIFPPVVSSFSPTEGAVGTSVTITGENFSDVPSENELHFGDVMASVPTSASTTSLTVVVPSGARTGSISVTVNGLTGTSSTDFTVIFPPVVSSFSPTEGTVGTSVTITGEYFSDVPSENELRFRDATASVPTSASTTSLTVVVPSGARTGRVSVTVGGQTGTSSTDFTVTVPAPPVVSSFSPTEGAVDTEVTITGVNFSEIPSENELRFGGVMAADPTSASTTSLTVRVPSGARTGSISVTVNGLTGTSSEDFTVTGTTPVSPFSVAALPGDVHVYPNPSSQEISFTNLSSARKYVYRVYSIVGQQVAKGTLKGRDPVSLSTLSAAQYILVLQEEGGKELLRTRLLLLE